MNEIVSAVKKYEEKRPLGKLGVGRKIMYVKMGLIYICGMGDVLHSSHGRREPVRFFLNTVTYLPV